MLAERPPFARVSVFACLSVCLIVGGTLAEEYPKPYRPPCVERENTFQFTEKPAIKLVSKDKYEITFAVKAGCDAVVALVDGEGRVVRHLACGVLGSNAPAPFQKSLKQKIYWNGKDDMGVYVKEPNKLKLRVQLGMKLTFYRHLGASNPEAMAGYVLGIATDKDGAYVIVRGHIGHNHITIRKFDHDAKYLRSLLPPISSMPESRLAGRAYVEYEKGKRDHHGPIMGESLGYDGNQIPCMYGKGMLDIQPVAVDGKLYFCSAGTGYHSGREPTMLYYIYTDGGTDVKGFTKREFFPWTGGNQAPRFAASPDGKYLYHTGAEGGRGGCAVVMRIETAGDGPSELFIGKGTKRGSKPSLSPGSDNQSLAGASGIDTDADGRIYVCDTFNNRVQIFSPDGKYLKTIKVDRPHLVGVHKKTGAIYVQHQGRVRGKSVPRLTKFDGFANLKEIYHKDGILTGAMAVDSWAPKTRLWIGGGMKRRAAAGGQISDRGPGVTVWEEDGKDLKKIADFDEKTRALAKGDYFGRWSGSVYDKVVCDPVREKAWYCQRKNDGVRLVFDLKTGKFEGEYRMGGATDDIAFDKKGYLHLHFNPGFYMPGVGRLDPDQAKIYRAKHASGSRYGIPSKRVFEMAEVPYDYGIPTDRPNRKNWAGVIPVKDQPGAKYFQDGFGVNMQGVVAEQCNIYHVPKMDEEARSFALSGRLERLARGQGQGPENQGPYAAFLRSIEESEKRGEHTFFIHRTPGASLAGATIWTFESSGELRNKLAANAGGVMAGCHIDEDGNLYFTILRHMNINGVPFLKGKSGNLGSDKPLDRTNRNPWMSTHVKVPGKGAKFLLQKAAVKLDPLPTRPVDWAGTGLKCPATWVEGAYWMYPGATPTSRGGCTCPSSRPHLDWFKRSYVPEGYRHSIGILDTNGNLIMHMGSYGNHDDALAMKEGTEDVRLTLPRFISGTDNYLCFDDWGERLPVLKIGYHAEETASIK
jgi:hypothetical protein